MSNDSPVSILFDKDGYAIGVSVDGVNRRLQTDAMFKPGSAITSSPIPSDPGLIVASKFELTGSSNMLVDGSAVPKVFSYNADPIKDIKLSEFRLVLSASSLDFVGHNFGDITELTNGIRIVVKSNGVLTDLANIKVNEDLLSFHSTGSIFVDESGPRDVISVGYLLGGAIVLKGGTDDYLGIIIRDNLTSSSFAYFQATGYGIKEI